MFDFGFLCFTWETSQHFLFTHDRGHKPYPCVCNMRRDFSFHFRKEQQERNIPETLSLHFFPGRMSYLADSCNWEREVNMTVPLGALSLETACLQRGYLGSVVTVSGPALSGAQQFSSEIYIKRPIRPQVHYTFSSLDLSGKN